MANCVVALRLLQLTQPCKKSPAKLHRWISSVATLTMRMWNILTANSMLVIISLQVGSKYKVFVETQDAIDMWRLSLIRFWSVYVHASPTISPRWSLQQYSTQSTKWFTYHKIIIVFPNRSEEDKAILARREKEDLDKKVKVPSEDNEEKAKR